MANAPTVLKRDSLTPTKRPWNVLMLVSHSSRQVSTWKMLSVLFLPFLRFLRLILTSRHASLKLEQRNWPNSTPSLSPRSRQGQPRLQEPNGQWLHFHLPSSPLSDNSFLFCAGSRSRRHTHPIPQRPLSKTPCKMLNAGTPT